MYVAEQSSLRDVKCVGNENIASDHGSWGNLELNNFKALLMRCLFYIFLLTNTQQGVIIKSTKQRCIERRIVMEKKLFLNGAEVASFEVSEENIRYFISDNIPCMREVNRKEFKDFVSSLAFVFLGSWNEETRKQYSDFVLSSVEEAL